LYRAHIIQSILLTEANPYLARMKSISEAGNRHGLHTAAKSEISGHAFSNYIVLLISRTNEFSLLQSFPDRIVCVSV